MSKTVVWTVRFSEYQAQEISERLQETGESRTTYLSRLAKEDYERNHQKADKRSRKPR